jgi:hypothetical protein
MWRKLAAERAKLLEQSKARLIWNYLPLNVSQMASAKLDHALASHRLDSSMYVSFPDISLAWYL